MSAHRAQFRRRASLVIASLALPGIVHGCSSPTSPPVPPGGGHTLSLSFETFQQTIDPILTQHGCDTVAGGDCHGGGINGSLRLSPPGAKDAQFDFDQVRLQVSATAVDGLETMRPPSQQAAE